MREIAEGRGERSGVDEEKKISRRDGGGLEGRRRRGGERGKGGGEGIGAKRNREGRDDRFNFQPSLPSKPSNLLPSAYIHTKAPSVL